MLIRNHLYDDTVTLTFDSARHRYVWEEENKEVPSVTTILKVINKPALINWAANTAVDYISDKILPGQSYDELQLMDIWNKAKKSHFDKKTDAADIGTFLHKWIEDYINGKKPGTPVNPELQLATLRFLKWVKEHDVKFLLSEQMIFSKKYCYSGLTDFICTMKGKLYIGDLKTSTGIYPEYMMQTAAYRLARTEEYPDEKYAGQMIVRIGKDGSFEFAVLEDDLMYTKMLEGFLSSLILKNSLESLERYQKKNL